MLSQRIAQILAAYQEPLTASFISFNLSDFSFDDICQELARMQDAGLVTLDYLGYQLAPQDDSSDVVDISEESSQPDIESKAEETATSEPPQEEPPHTLPSFGFEKRFQLDEGLRELLAMVAKEMARESNDELPSHETHEEPQVSDVIIEPESTHETLDAVANEERASEASAEQSLADDEPEWTDIPEEEARPEEARPEERQTNQEPDGPVAAPDSPDDTESCTPPLDETPGPDIESNESVEPIATRQPAERQSWEEVMETLVQEGLAEELEIYSDIPFIGAPRTSFRDDRDLLYAKLSGTAEGEGLGEYSDEPTIGAPDVASAIDEEFRKMLEEFASTDSPDSSARGPVIPTLKPTQELDEYRALLERLSEASTEDDSSAASEKESDTAKTPIVERGPVLSYDTPVSVFGFSTRVTNILSARLIRTVQDLVASLSTLYQANGAGYLSIEEIRNKLNSHAIDFPFKLSGDQIDALCKASGSDQYVFDIFGRLCLLRDQVRRPSQTPRSLPATTNPGGFTGLPDDNAPLDSFGLPNRLVRALSHAGFRTIGEAARLSEEQLLSLRGVGILAVERLNDLITELRASVDPAQLDGSGSIDDLQDLTESAAVLKDDSDEAEGARLALTECLDRNYPLLAEPFLICMPRAAAQSIGPDHTAEEYRDAIIELVEESDDLLDACQSTLATQVDLSKMLGDANDFIEEVRVLPHPLWEKAARRLAEADGWCFYDAERNVIKIRHPHLIDWIASHDFDEQTRIILNRYLGGDTLEECGKRVGLTRERIRQIVSKELRAVPAVEENRYRHFYETYRVTKRGFLSITGEPASTYAYLLATKTSKSGGSMPYTEALRDERVPQNVRDAIRRIKDKGYIYADGFRIPAKRNAIINHLVMRHATTKFIKLQKLQQLYDEFLQDNGLADNKSYRFNSAHAFESYVERCDQVMKLPHSTESKYGGSIRFYDSPSMDFEPLIQLLASGMLGDVECSATMLVNDEDFADVLEDLDIHNGYELHYVLNRYCPEIDGMVLGRTPNITFGKGNRNDQVLEMIKELSPITTGDLAAAYSARYGVDAATFMGSYLAPFKIYLKNGKYVYNSGSFDERQKKFVQTQLAAANGGYLSISLLKARFKDHFPKASTSLINDANISELGFYPSGGLLIRNGLEARALFGSLLDSKQRFSIDDEEFGKDVFDNMEFQAELAIRVRSYRLVEFEKGFYLSSRIFASLEDPLWPEDLRDYVDKAIEFMAPDTPYTVKSLIHAGFTHKIDTLRDDFGLSDFFFSSLLATGYVGGKLKVTSLGEIPVFCRTLYGYSAPVMFEQIVGKLEAIEVDDLKYLLEDAYGISIANTLIRTHVKRSDLYLNETLDMVFDSEETYRRKAREWIS